VRRTFLMTFLLLTLGIGYAQLTTLPDGPGKDLVYARCQACHDLGYVLDSAGIDRSAWIDTIRSMEEAGMEITPEEFDILLNYFVTYMGPNPPPPPDQEQRAQTPTAPTNQLDGSKVYAQNCAACHQAAGQGVPGAFPPLAKNPKLLADPDYATLVVLFGLQGPIQVGGQTYNGAMPPFGHLSDAQIAAVINFVRSSWGNDALAQKGAKPLAPEDVARLREKGLSPQQVLEYRKRME